MCVAGGRSPPATCIPHAAPCSVRTSLKHCRWIRMGGDTCYAFSDQDRIAAAKGGSTRPRRGIAGQERLLWCPGQVWDPISASVPGATLPTRAAPSVLHVVTVLRDMSSLKKLRATAKGEQKKTLRETKKP